MYNGLLRFNKHILNELAEGLKHLPNNGLKKCIRKKIKDKDFLMILDEIIDSTDNVRDVSSKLTNKIGIGVPIGNYLSQYFANLYLSELDHLCKEELKCKFYYRYADDIVILSDDKYFLHKVLIYIKLYVHINFKITKYDWRIYTKNRKENIKPQI